MNNRGAKIAGIENIAIDHSQQPARQTKPTNTNMTKTTQQPTQTMDSIDWNIKHKSEACHVT